MCKVHTKFSDITEPLRSLTTKNARFLWNDIEECAFNGVKGALPVTQLWYISIPTNKLNLLHMHRHGVFPAILSQCTPGTNDRRAVAHISRSLSYVERRYAQTDREALAIVWALPLERLYFTFTFYFEIFHALIAEIMVCLVCAKISNVPWVRLPLCQDKLLITRLSRAGTPILMIYDWLRPP